MKKILSTVALMMAILIIPMASLVSAATVPRAEKSAGTEEISKINITLPSDMKDFGEALKEIAADQNIQLNIKTVNRGKSYAGKLIELTKGKNTPDIFWVQGESDARQVKDGGVKFYNYLSKKSGPAIRQLTNTIPAVTYILNPEKVYGLPLGLYAQGYLVNLDLLAALIGTDDTVRLARDLTACSYTEWEALCTGIAEYLQGSKKTVLTLDGHRYIMPKSRAKSTRGLRGLFSIPTAETGSLAQNTLSMAYAAAFENEAALLNTSTDQLSSVMDSSLKAAYGLLELETKYLTDSKGTLVRGENYVKHLVVTAEEAKNAFVKGEALLYKGTTQTGLAFEGEYPALSGKLAIIPSKLPIASESVAQINSMHGIAANGYLCVNKSSKVRSDALNLLLELFASQDGIKTVEQCLDVACFSDVSPENPINRQVIEAVRLGKAYQMPTAAIDLSAAQNTLGQWISTELMPVAEWGEEQETAFVNNAKGSIAAIDYTGTAPEEELPPEEG